MNSRGEWDAREKISQQHFGWKIRFDSNQSPRLTSKKRKYLRKHLLEASAQRRFL
jgi:hypothetical protein